MQRSSEEFQQTLEQLYARAAGGVKPGLETITRLLEALGDPHRRYPIIHVAGTNGKGSVCAMVESILRAHGLKTGLFTSPHLISFNERFKVNGDDIADEALDGLIQAVDEVDQRSRGEERESTFFEFATALAFEWFAENEVQVAIIETGLGGRWDSTNVVCPVVSAITRIDMDHERFLGNTLLAVASEKAGIIKEGIPVVISPQREEVFALLKDVAHERSAQFLASEEQVVIEQTAKDLSKVSVESTHEAYGQAKMPFAGPHQLENLAVSVATVELFLAAFGGAPSAANLCRGIEQAQWPGRFQQVSSNPVFYIDGAHNPSAAKALQRALTERWGSQTGAFVTGCMRDKEVVETLSILGPLMGAFWAVPVESPRSMDPYELLADAERCGVQGQVATLKEAVAAAQAWALENNSYVCLTGSLHLLGDFLKEDAQGFSSTGLIDYV